MSCPCRGNEWNAFVSCLGVTPQFFLDDNGLMNYAAQAGARSSDNTLCFVMGVLKIRRLIYGRAVAGIPPTTGDCGTSALGPIGSTRGVTVGLGTFAGADPEPISKSILSGLAAVFGGFTAAHAARVRNEEDVLCKVATAYNQYAPLLERAVTSGNMTPDQASALHSQIVQQLDSVCATIYKSCNASCFQRMSLRALEAYMANVVFPALEPGAPEITPQPSEPVGTMFPFPVGTIPGNATGSPSSYAGASGFTPKPMNANNIGTGPTSASLIPAEITPGTIIIIGGVAFIASRL